MFYHADSPTSPVIEGLKIVACFITQNSGQIGQYNLIKFRWNKTPGKNPSN